MEETETTEGEWDLNMTYGSGGGVRVRWTTVNHFGVVGAGATGPRPRVESQNQQFYKSHETRNSHLLIRTHNKPFIMSDNLHNIS